MDTPFLGNGRRSISSARMMVTASVAREPRTIATEAAIHNLALALSLTPSVLPFTLS